MGPARPHQGEGVPGNTNPIPGLRQTRAPEEEEVIPGGARSTHRRTRGPEALTAHAGRPTASLATWTFSSPRTRPGSSLPGVTCSPFRCMNSRDSAAEGRAGLLPGLVRLPSPSREQMGILVHATNSSCQEQTRLRSEARTTVMNAQKHLHAGPGPLDPYLGLDGLVSEMNSGTTSN